MNIEEIKQALAEGEWVSIASELRPSLVKTASGDIKPLYCSRRFVYSGADRFQLDLINYADPYGQVPLVEMRIAGHVKYGAPHPIAPGAYEADYVADEIFFITLLNSAFVSALNSTPLSEGIQPWELNVPRNVLGKSVPAFGLKAGEYFTEYDLIYIQHRRPSFRQAREQADEPAGPTRPKIKRSCEENPS
jgi:hypothetical protein